MNLTAIDAGAYGAVSCDRGVVKRLQLTLCAFQSESESAAEKVRRAHEGAAGVHGLAERSDDIAAQRGPTAMKAKFQFCTLSLPSEMITLALLAVIWSA